MEFVTIESHFGVPEHMIRAHTRNQCSEDLVTMIQEVALILYPEQEFEVYLLPSEVGSYKDIIRILNKNSGAITAVCAVGALVFTFLTYIKDTTSEDVSKCLSLQTQIETLRQQGYEIENIPTEKLDEVCGNLKLTKLKNDRYQTLLDDGIVSEEETILKNAEAKEVSKKTIKKEAFQMCIEAVPENEDYSKENVNGFIELISLVVKQKKEGKGIPWKGIYYGEDVKERGIDVLLNGEEISFYMQDKEFKQKIDAHEISFSSGDNMGVIFNIRGSLKIDFLQNKSIYITEVQKFNEDIVEHKVKIARRQQKQDPTDQLPFPNFL